MSFNEAMYQVLQTRPYDYLTGRRISISDFFEELLINILINFFEWLDLDDYVFENIDGLDLRTISTIFATVGIVIVIICFVILVKTILRFKQGKYMNQKLHDIFEGIENQDLTVKRLLEMSQTAFDMRNSIRFGYLAVLLALNEKEIIHISPSATNRLILQNIKDAHPNLTEPFSQMVKVFHLSWFGYKNIKDEDFKAFQNALSMLAGEL